MTTDTTGADLTATETSKELLGFIERIEKVEEERKSLGDDVKDIYAEAKGRGYATGVMRKIVARRKIERAELEEEDAMLELYEEALAKVA